MQQTTNGSPGLESRLRTFMRSELGASHRPREGRTGQILPHIRHFSSTEYRARQELYTPIERPLKKTAKKKYDKILEERDPDFYPYMDEQLAALVKVNSRVVSVALRSLDRTPQRFRTPGSRVQEREALCGRLRSVVQSSFGTRYDVRDMSAHLYATDVVTFPFEFYVVVSRNCLLLNFASHLD